jgi:hypothetical protein
MFEIRILIEVDNGKISEHSTPSKAAIHLCEAVMQPKLRSERGLHTASVT